MKSLLKLLAIISLIVVGTLISFLLAYVVLDIAELYEIGVITQYSQLQIYGIVALVTLILHKYKANTKQETLGDVVALAVVVGISKTLTILLSWATLHIVYAVVV